MRTKTLITKENSSFALIPSAPYGNCLFESCFNGLKLNGLAADITHYKQLREIVSQSIAADSEKKYQEYIYANLQAFKQQRGNVDHDYIYSRLLNRINFDTASAAEVKNEYVKIMQRPGEWGGDIELSAIADIFNVDLIIYTPGQEDGNTTFCSVKGREIKIRLYYSNLNHYDLLATNIEYQKHFGDHPASANDAPAKTITTVADTFDEIFTPINDDLPPESTLSEIEHLLIQESGNRLDFEYATIVPPSRVIGWVKKASSVILNFKTNKGKPLESSDLNPFLNASLDSIAKELKLNCEFTAITVYSDFCRILNLANDLDTKQATINQNNTLIHSVYSYFHEIQLATDLVDKANAADMKHKNAQLAYNLVVKLLRYAITDAEYNKAKKCLQLCNLFAENCKEKALPDSQLLKDELPKLQNSIIDNLQRHNGQPALADNVSMLILLHIYEQDTAPQLENLWKNYLVITYSMAKIYQAYDLPNISHSYLQKCLIVYKNYYAKTNFQTEIPEQDLAEVQTNEAEFKLNLDTAPDNGRLDAVISQMHQAIREPASIDDIQLFDTPIEQHSYFWRLLEQKFGSLHESELVDNDEVKIFAAFESITSTTSFDDACQKLAATFQIEVAGIVEFFVEMELTSPEKIHNFVINTTFDFINKTLAQRKNVLNQMAEFHCDVLKKISSYQFVTSKIDNSLKDVLSRFAQQNLTDPNEIIQTYAEAINFCVLHNIIPSFQADNILLPLLRSASLNHSSYAKYLHEKMKFLAQVAINDFEPHVVSEEKRTIFVFEGHTTALTVLKRKIEEFINIKGFKPKEIRIFLTNTLYVDADINEKHFKGVNLNIIAENLLFIKREKFHVDLSGFDADDERDLTAKKHILSDNDLLPGTQGKAGISGHNGKNGGSAGHLSILANFISGDIDPNATGGKASYGGHGGNGTDGIKGRDGVHGKEYFDRTVLKGYDKYRAHGSWLLFSEYSANEVKYPTTKAKLEDGKYPWNRTATYVIAAALGEKGQSGGKGGVGGNGGCKGLGGKGGLVHIRALSQNKSIMRVMPSGIDGEDGNPGIGGLHSEDGKDGIDYGRTFPRKSFWKPWAALQKEEPLEGKIAPKYFNRDIHKTSWVGKYYGNLETPSCSEPKQQDRLKTDVQAGTDRADKGTINDIKNVANANLEINLKRSMLALQNLVNTTPMIGVDGLSEFASALAIALNVDFKITRATSREQHINSNYEKWVRAISNSKSRLLAQTDQETNTETEHEIRHQLSQEINQEPQIANQEPQIANQASKVIDALFVAKPKIDPPLKLKLQPSLLAMITDYNLLPIKQNLIHIIEGLNDELLNTLSDQNDPHLVVEFIDDILNESIATFGSDKFKLTATFKHMLENRALKLNKIADQYFTNKLNGLSLLESLKHLVFESLATQDCGKVRGKYYAWTEQLAGFNLNNKVNLDGLISEIISERLNLVPLNVEEHKETLRGLFYGAFIEHEQQANLMRSLEQYDKTFTLSSLKELMFCMGKSLALTRASFHEQSEATITMVAGSLDRLMQAIKHNLNVHAIFAKETYDIILAAVKIDFAEPNLNLYDLVFLSAFSESKIELLAENDLPSAPILSGIFSALGFHLPNAVSESDLKVDLAHLLNIKHTFSQMKNNYLLLNTLCHFGHQFSPLIGSAETELRREQLVELLFQILKKSIKENIICSRQDERFYEILFRTVLPKAYNQTIAHTAAQVFGADFRYFRELVTLSEMHKLGAENYLIPTVHNTLIVEFYKITEQLNLLIQDHIIPYYLNTSKSKRHKDPLKRMLRKAKKVADAILEALPTNMANLPLQAMESGIQEVLALIARFTTDFSKGYVSHSQIVVCIKLIETCIGQLEKILAADMHNSKLKLLRGKLDDVITLFKNAAKSREKHELYSALHDALEVSETYANFRALASLNSQDADITKYLKGETHGKYDKLLAGLPATSAKISHVNYFYLELNMDEENSWFSVNNQLIKTDNNITFSIIFNLRGEIFYSKNYSSASQDKLLEDLEEYLPLLDNKTTFLIKVNGTTLNPDVFKLFGLDNVAKIAYDSLYVVNKKQSIFQMQISEPGFYKVQDGFFINMRDIKNDSPFSIFDVLQEKYQSSQLTRLKQDDANHQQLQERILSRFKSKPVETTQRKFQKKLDVIDFISINALNRELESLRTSSLSKNATECLALQSFNLALEALNSGDYSILSTQSEMIRALLKISKTKKYDNTTIEQVIKSVASFSSPTEVIKIIETGNLEGIQLRLCLERLSECFLYSSANPDAIKLAIISNQLSTLEERLLNVFYKKYVSEYYNILYQSKSQSEKHVAAINEARLVSIISALKLIKVDNDSLVTIINTPIMNWESELYAIRANQFIQAWPDLLSKDNLLLVFMLNRIRLRLGNSGFHEYMDFLNLIKNKVGTNIDELKLLVKHLYYNGASFADGVAFATNNQASNWSEIRFANNNISADIDPNEGIDYEKVLQTIILKNPELEPKIKQIREIAEKIKLSLNKKSLLSAFDLTNETIAAAFYKPKILAFLSQLDSLGSIQEREAWLFKKDEHNNLNIEGFIKNICLAWLYSDSKSFLPRDTQIVALLLYLLINDSGLLLEIKTGQGKTTIVALLAAAKALLGYKVDIVTSNTDLAEDGHKICSKFYELIGLQSCTIPDNPATHVYYEKHILYSDAKGFQRDICLSRTVNHDMFSGRYADNYSKACLIVDEVDSLSLDKASDMLYLTHQHSSLKYNMDLLLQNIRILVRRVFTREDFNSEHFNKNRDAYVKQIVGMLIVDDKLQECLEVPDYLHDYCKQHMHKFVVSAMRSFFMQTNDHFKISPEEITVMDKPTGSESHSTTYSEGLHQFLQLKHGHVITQLGLCSNYISNLSFFKRYHKNISGMTGTLGSKESRDFLQAQYNVKMIDLPSHLPSKFTMATGKVCTQETWAKLIAIDSIERSSEQPILIISDCISDVDLIKAEIDKLLTERGLERNILIYKEEKDNLEEQLEKRKSIQATRHDIIIATNKGGRGTDIPINIAEAPKGLHVFLSYLPTNLRIELQAFGRAARNGQPGSGSFIIPVKELAEDPELQIERMIVERDEREQQRVQIIQEINLPQVKMKEELLEKFNSVVKLAMLNLHSRQIDKPLQSACLTILNHRWAFWLESIKDDIEKITHISVNAAEQLLHRFTQEVDIELSKIFNHSKDVLQELPKKPEDALLIADAYQKMGDHAKASIFYQKSIDMGLLTSYPEQAAAICYAQNHDTKQTVHKKAIRKLVKSALHKMVKFKSNYEISLTLQELSNKSKANLSEDWIDLHLKALESRVNILGLHVGELTAHIGKELTNELLKSAMGEVNEDTLANTIKHLAKNNYLTTNYIRKKWTKNENVDQLKDLLSKAKKFADPDRLFTIITDPHNQQKNILKDENFTAAIYCRDDIIEILQQNSVIQTTFKKCIKIDITSALSFEPSSEHAESWHNFLAKLLLLNLNNNAVVLFESDQLYKDLIQQEQLYKHLIRVAVCKETQAYSVTCNEQYTWHDFDKINFGKYAEIPIRQANNTCRTLRQEIWAQIQSVLAQGSGYLFMADLPFNTKDNQIQLLLAYLHQECFILKSNTLNTDIKHTANEKELKKRINAALQEINLTCTDPMLALFQELQGNIRKIDDALVLSFVEPETLPGVNKSEQKINFDFFTDGHLDKFLSVTQSKFWFYIDLLLINLIAVIQLIAGIMLIVFCPGIGALLGEALIELAIQDFFCAFSTFMSGERIDWSAWAIQKGISSCLTLGSALTFGIGVPFARVNTNAAAKVMGLISKSIALRMATIVTTKMLDEFVKNVMSDVVENTSTRISQRFETEFLETFDQLEQSLQEDAPELYDEAISELRGHLRDRMHIVAADNKNNVNITNAVTNALDGVGNVVYGLTKQSSNDTVRTIGAVIAVAGTASRLSSVFQQACQFEELSSGLSRDVRETDTIFLDGFIPSNDRARHAAEARYKREFSPQVTQDAGQLKKDVKQNVAEQTHEMVTNPFNTLFKVKLSGFISKDTKATAQRDDNSMRQKMSEFKFAYLSDAPPDNCEGNFANDYKIKKYSVADLPKYLAQAPDMPRHYKLNHILKQNSAAIKAYSKNLENDPYGLFELDLIADKEKIGIRIYNVKFELKSTTLPKAGPQNIRKIIDIVEDKPKLEPRLFLPSQCVMRTVMGKPIKEVAEVNMAAIPVQKTLLFSVLCGIQQNTPSCSDIDNYRQQLIEYSAKLG